MAKNTRRKKRKIVDNYNPPYAASVLSQSIDVLELPEEISEKLKSAKIDTIFAVVKLDQKALLHVNRFNKKNLVVLENALRKKRLAIKPTEKVFTPKQQPSKKTLESESKETNPRTAKQTTTEAKEREARQRNRPKTEPVVFEKDIYIKINKNGKWGFEDRIGKEVVAPVYDEAFNYKEDLCCVMIDEKYGFIDREGNVIIPLEYDLAFSFSEGYACVYRGEKCGYINKNNEVIVKFQFDAGTPVENNECRIKKAGQWGELRLDNPDEIRWIV